MKNIFFLCLVLFLFPFSALAQMSIIEVMYDPEGTDSDAGGEWIEVKAESSINDLTSWKVADRTGESGTFTNRALTHVSGPATLKAGDYAIFAKDPEAFQSIFSYSGPLFKSAFSLTDDDVIRLLDSNLSEVDEVAFTSQIGGKGDGNTLQKSGATWTNGTPTPGSDFAGGTKGPNEEDDEDESDDSSDDLSSHSGPAPLSNAHSTKPLSLYIGEDRLTAVGSPIQFIAEVKNPTDPKRKPKFLWSMGDGQTREGDEIEYQYDRAGNYAVVLNAYEKDRQGTARISVTVVESDLVLTGEENGDITIQNKGGSEINLYNFRLEGGDSSFRFPLDTILLEQSALTLSAETTRLVFAENEVIQLRNPNGDIVAEWQAQSATSSVMLFEIIPASFFAKASAPTASTEQTSGAVPESVSLSLEASSTLENEVEEMPQTASVASAFSVEKPQSFWQKIGGFFRGIFD